MVRRVILLSIILLGIIKLYSEEFTSKITASSESVGVNEPFQIEIEITGENNFNLQGIDNLDASITINYMGINYLTSMINGVMSSSQTLSFYVVISKEGKYNLGPFKFKVKDKIYKTDVLTINVISLNKKDSETQNINKKNEDNTQNNEMPDNKNINYIIKTYINKKESYINDPIEITVKFFIRAELQQIKYNALQLPSNSWIENILTDNDRYAGITNINNIQYKEYNIEKKRIYITRDSVYNIPPVEYQFVGYKDNDFFADPEQILLRSNPVTINIKPLPPNPPAGFNGAVGSFKFTSSIDKINTKVKEPVNLKITLDGAGNFQNIKDAGYTIDKNFEIYSSKDNITGNGINNIKTWDILTVPAKAGNLKIKVNDFIYFDITKKEYVRLKGNEYTINVESGMNKKEDESVIINKSEEQKLTEKNSDINYIKTIMGNKNTYMNYNLWFNILILIYILIVVFLIIFIFSKYLIFNRFIRQNEINRKNSYRIFSHQINNLEINMKKNFSNKAIDTISTVTESYFKSKFGIDSIEFTRYGIQEKLGKFLKNEEVDVLKDIFIKIDMQRFGGIDLNKSEIYELIKKVTSLIKQIEIQGKS